MDRAMMFLAVLGLVVLSGCTSAEGVINQNYDFTKVDEVAIVEVESADLDRAQEDQISDWFAAELLRAGYSPIERRKAQALLREQDFQASDLTSPTNAAQAGRILNVPAVIMISVPNFGRKTSMTAKMVDVETAEIVWIGEGSTNTRSALATIGGAVIGAGTGYALGGDSTGEAVGAAAGGLIGGGAGYLLSGDAKKLAKKAIRKMAATLPNRMGSGL
jgi:outer membrane lipoprotein SlyB